MLQKTVLDGKNEKGRIMMKRFGLKKVFSIAIIIAFLLGTNLMGSTAAENRIFNDMPHTGNVFADMEKQIDYFKEDGNIRNDIAVRALKLHISGVRSFSKTRTDG